MPRIYMPWKHLCKCLTIWGMAIHNTTKKAKTPALVTFGEAVRARRKERGFSQEAFGDACGIDRSYMGGIERGEHNLALINILKIIRALQMQPSEFFSALDGIGTASPSSLGIAEPLPIQPSGKHFQYAQLGQSKQRYEIHESEQPQPYSATREKAKK